MTLKEISLNKKKYIIGAGIFILVLSVIKSLSATYDQMYADWEKRAQLKKEQKKTRRRLILHGRGGKKKQNKKYIIPKKKMIVK